ncbi:MAG: hypothetical protein ACQEP4_05255 [Bacillota bacterium]
MYLNGEGLLGDGRDISVFIEYMKNRDEDSLELARKALRNIKSYSSTRKDGQGYRIRVKCKNEEKTFSYSFPFIYGDFMDSVAENVDLGRGKIGYLENTGGFLLNYMAQRGFDSVGFTMDEEEWERCIFSNFPVYRREYLKREMPELVCGTREVPKLDKFIWIVKNYKEEKDFVQQLLKGEPSDILMVVSKKECLNLEEFRGKVHIDRSLKSRGGECRFIFISQEDKPERKGTTLPEGLQVLKSESAIFKVKMDKCRDNNGFMYTERGHYFVETLKQYEENNELSYEDSYLREYYDKFQPRNRRDNYLWQEEVECFPMCHGWLFDPWRNPANPPLKERRFETRRGGNHNIGPNTQDFGRAEFKRLTRAYDILREAGYNPDFFVDGYITGYLLIKNADYRFIASEGQHRIAALAALGFEEFLCRFDLKPWTNETVFYNQASKWPQVKAGIFTVSVAKMCFDHFFRVDNNNRLLNYMNG